MDKSTLQTVLGFFNGKEASAASEEEAKREQAMAVVAHPDSTVASVANQTRRCGIHISLRIDGIDVPPIGR